MSTLRYLTQVGIHTRGCVFKQIIQQQKLACTALVNFQGNRRNYAITQFKHLINPQVLSTSTYLSYLRFISSKSTPDRAGKTETKSSAVVSDDLFAETSKLGLFAKFKLMYKKYWYVLIPVHIVTSIGWFGGFYYLSQSGVDIPSLLSHLHVSEGIIDKVKNSSMGHLAIAYLCYKIATPLRYALTLGGTTVSIKYLVQAGHIKPMPTKQQLMDLYEQKKADRAAAKEKEK